MTETNKGETVPSWRVRWFERGVIGEGMLALRDMTTGFDIVVSEGDVVRALQQAGVLRK